MRKVPLLPGEYYHIYNRGTLKTDIFRDDADRARFLFCLLHFQSPITFRNINRRISKYLRTGSFDVDPDTVSAICADRIVALVNYALMPNHFHATILELKEGGISNYMQRISTALAMTAQRKHEHSGHLFQGPFKSKHISSDEQLIYLSAYIHRNPRELKRWRGREHQYPWSSYKDYIQRETHGGLLCPDIILDQHSNRHTYKQFVDGSGAKDLEAIGLAI